MRTIDIAWAAGFLEGDGSFGIARVINITAVQIQLEPLLKLQKLFGGAITGRPTPKGDKILSRWQVYSGRAAELMMTFYPLMSLDRKKQIQKALKRWRATGPASRDKTHCPQGHVYDKVYQAKDPTLKIQRYRYCRTCHNAACSRWNEKHPERHEEIMQSYYRRRKERQKEGVNLSKVRLNA